MAEIPPCKKKLEGKVAIITGGASGIGEATARLFANQGALAVVIADIQDEKGQNVAESIGLESCTYVHCDVADEQQVKTLVESTVQNYGHLDIMFSNAAAGSPSDKRILDLDLTYFDRTFAVNARGMAACVKHAARAMVEGAVHGSIICTGSLASSHGTDVVTGYTMSKHAVLGLVRSASRQLGEYQIRVNCVSPGGVATPMSCNGFKMSEEEMEKFFQPSMILKGNAMKARNIADAVLFLASEDSAFVTGHDLLVDGGFRSPVV